MARHLADRQILESLDLQRCRVIDVVADLDDEQCRRSLVGSGWTPIGMIRHLRLAEGYWFERIAGGRDVPDPWATPTHGRDWEVGVDRRLDEVVAEYAAAVRRAREAIDEVSLDSPPGTVDVRLVVRHTVPNVRWIVMHMIEETARHAGHLDIVRELIDGTTGRGRG